MTTPFAALPFEPAEDDEGFDQERSRFGAPRARPPMRRAAPPRVRAAPRQRPRPRPRPLPAPWPPYGAGYAFPVGSWPGAAAPSGSTADDERWRCVQACFGRTGMSPPEPAPDADATPDAGAPAPEPAPEELEFEQGFETSAGLLTLPAAIANPRAAGPGIYTLFKDGRRVYVGRARQLRRRLQQHLLCLTHLKLGIGRFRVKLTPLPGATAARLSRVESAVIGRFGRASAGGALANVKSREF